MRIYWSEEEINHLKDYYEIQGLSISEFYEEFTLKYPHRTKISIEVKIKKLKLRHTKEQISKLKSRLNSGENNGMYGKVGPNNGITKENSERMRIAAIKISETRKEMFIKGLLDNSGENNGMYGKDSWNKGLTKYSDKRMMLMSEKMSEISKNRWENYTDEEKNKIIGNLSLAANKAKKDTKIEIIVKETLEKLNISFIKNYKCSRYIFDFYLLDYNFVIECQGDYWHCNPIFFNKPNNIQLKNIERDKRKIEYLEINNIQSLFMWENEIHKNKDILDKIILEKLVF